MSVSDLTADGGFVDIHAHVLPGVDDGPSDLAQALETVRAASDAGTTTIAATPHLRSDFPGVRVDELALRCEALQRSLRRERLDVRIVAGAEVSLSWALDASKEALRLASYGQRGSDLLIETPSALVGGIDSLLYELHLRGFRITLAHPERSTVFQRDYSQLEKLVNRGTLLQVNADHLLGRRSNSAARDLARKLCLDGLMHVIASDGHDAGTRRPVSGLGAAVKAAAALVGPAQATWLARDAPASIIGGVELPERPAATQSKRFSRLRSR